MEGFLESFLYLLITIIILVLSMRKKKPVEEEAQETRTDDPFRDIFAEQEEEEYEDETEGHPEVVPQEYRKQPEAAVTWMTESDAKDSLMDADQIMKEATDNNPIAREDIAEIDAYGVGETEDSGIRFNLKKAVIYSVILERKTF
jgi:hypothetical protein